MLATVNAYGPGGPYSERPGFNAIGQAMSGAMYLQRQPGAPARAAVPYVDLSTAQALAMGVLAALWSRERSGRGQQVEGSLQRSALVMGNAAITEQPLRAPDRVPQGNRGFTAAPSDAFRARGGWLMVPTVGRPMFERWCKLIGRPELVAALRRRRPARRPQPRNQRADERLVRTRNRDEPLHALARARIPAAPVLSPQQALDDPHIRAAGLRARRVV
ncbi:MAG TPA: CoA transferase [Rubrivivax sp.]|nr:CoA transferase [Rubrivivax sp.]